MMPAERPSGNRYGHRRDAWRRGARDTANTPVDIQSHCAILLLPAIEKSPEARISGKPGSDGNIRCKAHKTGLHSGPTPALVDIIINSD